MHLGTMVRAMEYVMGFWPHGMHHVAMEYAMTPCKSHGIVEYTMGRAMMKIYGDLLGIPWQYYPAGYPIGCRWKIMVYP